jgi:predicted dehydrogenase
MTTYSLGMTNMTNKPIGVGIIGAGEGWASAAHLPALAALPSYRVVAVSTTRQESADATARHFGVPHAFDRPGPLLALPDVELVLVSVRAPRHAPLVREALAAGKHVLCEWPVGATLAETTELAVLAKSRGVVAMAGLQRRFAPAMQKLRTLVAEGYLGRLRSVHVHVALPILGARRPAAWASTADLASGANALHTVTAHMLDPILTAVGEPTSFSALVARQIETTTLEETGEVLPVTAPDQIAVIGTLAGGAVLSLRVECGKRNGGGVAWTLTGTEGDIEIGGDLSLRGARGDGQPLAPIPVEPWLPKGDLSNDAHDVAHLYLAIAKGLRGKPDPLVATFDDAVRLRQMLEAFVDASTTGKRL